MELAAPVFNQRGYVGASMRDLVDATGLEKGGIYNHFGSKEQLALEAYDHAMTLVTERLARSQKPRARRDPAPAVDDPRLRDLGPHPGDRGRLPDHEHRDRGRRHQPELRDRARASMTLWHRLIGRIVKDGIAAGTVAPTPIRTRSRRCSPARSKAG